MTLNVGINGFGRIGRIIFRCCLQNPNLKVTAINDPAVDIDYICYLIKFDSTHGKFKGSVERLENCIVVDGQKIAIFREKLPTNIPWQTADVQYIIEASGMFTNLENASGHLASDGVKRVIVTAPSPDVPMVVLGVNDDRLSPGHKVISCASSTLYCLAPIINILEENFGVSEGFVTSIHAMTPSLKPLDGLCLKGKHWRDHRSIHQNIIPATTGACRALGKIIPQVKDKMTGLAFRVPIVNVSVLDITIREQCPFSNTCLTKKADDAMLWSKTCVGLYQHILWCRLKSNTTMDQIVRHIENSERINRNGVIKVSNEQAVSSDFIGDTHSCILDLNASLQLSPDFFKLICWYENEYSYACRVIDSIFFLENKYQAEWISKMACIRPSGYHQKMIYNEVYSCNSNSKSLCSTSQDSGFKSPKQPLLTKKPVSCRNFEKPLPYASRVPKKKNELFKIWNDDDDVLGEPVRNNRTSFFHSCLAITPQIKENTFIKTQKRLDNVKKEFSKMVSMTENLLRQSQNSKEKGLTEEPTNDEAGDSNKFKVRDKPKLLLDDEILNRSSIKDNLNEIIKNAYQETVKAVNVDVKNNISEKEEAHYIVNERNLISNATSSVETKTVKNVDSLVFIPTLKNENSKLEDNQLKLDKSFLSDNKQVKNVMSLENGNEINIKSGRVFNEKSMKNCCKTAPINLEGHNINLKPVKSSQCSRSLEQPSAVLLENIHNKDMCRDEKTQKFESMETQLKECRNRNLQRRLEGILKKLSVDSNVISEKPSVCLSLENTGTTISNRHIKHKSDIYDKLDSVSATDSENSFHMNERKSQVINIKDLTNSLEDLERLDKICRIIEISDDLSDQLLSALNNCDRKDLKNKKWSFRDLCERIKLDDFCNKIFTKTNN